MLHDELKHSYNSISFLNRVNDRDDYFDAFKKKVTELIGFVRYGIQSISVRGRYVSIDNIKLPCIIDIFSGSENFIHYFRRKTMNIFVYFG